MNPRHRLVIARDWGKGGNRGPDCLMSMRFLFWHNENILKLEGDDVCGMYMCVIFVWSLNATKSHLYNGWNGEVYFTSIKENKFQDS